MLKLGSGVWQPHIIVSTKVLMSCHDHVNEWDSAPNIFYFYYIGLYISLTRHRLHQAQLPDFDQAPLLATNFDYQACLSDYKALGVNIHLL